MFYFVTNYNYSIKYVKPFVYWSLLGIPLAICIEQNPACVISSVSVPIEGSGNPNSSRWLVFVDNSIQKTCVGTGGPEAHPGLLTYSGTFHIEILEKDPLRYNSYKLVFCFAGSDYKNCSYIGTYDNGEGGRRLILTETNPFLFSFVHALKFDGTIKSVGWMIYLKTRLDGLEWM